MTPEYEQEITDLWLLRWRMAWWTIGQAMIGKLTPGATLRFCGSLALLDLGVIITPL